MTRYQQLMEDLIFELLVEKRFNIKLLEEMMQIRAPGPYRLETSSTTGWTSARSRSCLTTSAIRQNGCYDGDDP